MIETLKALILDFQEDRIVTGISRHLKIDNISGKATICIGVRRCGKSTYQFQLIQFLLQCGISIENILYVNFFDDRLHSMHQKDLGMVTEAYYSLYPDKKNSQTVYCFFDEIQMVPGWESFIDRLMRTELCEVFITGSSAKMLSTEIATQMRGRALSWELFPFSFREFLDYKGIEKTDRLSTKKRLIVQKAFEEYWQTGGFPEVAGLDRRLRIKIHQEYLQAMLYHDLIERHDISHPKALTDLAYRLIDNVASMYTVNRLTGYLKSLGHKAPKSAVSNYLKWFEDAFFLFTVKLFDASLTRSNANPKKIYCIDHAFVTSITSGILVNSGHLLENLVFTALRKITERIFYYKTQNGGEVDFIILDQHNTRILVQVSETLVNPQTRKREITALSDAMVELKIGRGTIVTRNEEEQIDIRDGRIDVLPIWRFLYNLADR